MRDPQRPGPGYTPMARTDQAMEREPFRKRHVKPVPEQNLPSDVEEGLRRGSFVNEETGEVRYFESDPPQEAPWLLLSPNRVSLAETKSLWQAGACQGCGLIGCTWASG